MSLRPARAGLQGHLPVPRGSYLDADTAISDNVPHNTYCAGRAVSELTHGKRRPRGADPQVHDAIAGSRMVPTDLLARKFARVHGVPVEGLLRLAEVAQRDAGSGAAPVVPAGKPRARAASRQASRRSALMSSSPYTPYADLPA